MTAFACRFRASVSRACQRERRNVANRAAIGARPSEGVMRPVGEDGGRGPTSHDRWVAELTLHNISAQA